MRGDPVANLYDITHGNYQVHRTVSYSEFPNSRLVFDAKVKAVSKSEWSTTIDVSGSYDGPRDVIGVEDYRLEWANDGKTLAEKGVATLRLSSGGSVHMTWVSSILPDAPDFERFAKAGETVSVKVSPFRISGNRMTYDWTGTVEPTRQ